jgi:NADH-quinone oxidoreductase subunit L
MHSAWTQDATLLAAILATLLPFLAFVLIMVATLSWPRLSAGLSIAAVTVSLGCAVFLLEAHWNLEKPIQYTARWLVSGDINIPLGYLLDPTSLLMLTTVALISFLIQVYSLGYMAGDPGFSRYYAFLSLFVWAMMCLALAPNLFQLYIFWELVGLSSYFLIGFWYEKFSASQAGKKALVMTRVGDVSLLLGILLVLLHLGNLNILEIDSPEVAAHMSPNLLTLSALLIFGGIIGKSAQFPLLTWLPDAMEGPTPVSALLHSSTMVAAGVYLFERLFPFFLLSPVAMTVGLAIGAVSMLMAATMAMVSRDMKQILAYSTISQLGFMIMGLDAGSFFSGVFHLTTHAGFKALLFLCAGVFIHKYATNDIFELARQGGRGLKIPMTCTLIGAAALAGIPPLSGFFSKEAILAGLANLSNPIWLAAGLLGVFLTAYYAFRMIFILLFPRTAMALAGAAKVAISPKDRNPPWPPFEKGGNRPSSPFSYGATNTSPFPNGGTNTSPFSKGGSRGIFTVKSPEANAHGPGGPHSGHAAGQHRRVYWVMAWPLIILAGITVMLGFLQSPLETFLGHQYPAVALPEAAHIVWLPYLALILTIGGVGLAWAEFGRRDARQVGFVERIPVLYRLFTERWYLDHFYRLLVDRVIDRGIATLFFENDNKVIDGSIDGMCKGTVAMGRLLAFLNSAMIQYRLLATFAVLVLLSLYLFLKF